MLTSRGIFDPSRTKNEKQFIRFCVLTLPKNWKLYLFKLISDGFNSKIPILKSKYKSRSKKDPC